MKIETIPKVLMEKLKIPLFYVTLPIAIATSFTFFSGTKISEYFKPKLTESMVTALFKENESYLKNDYLEGLLKNFHDDFTMVIEHPSDREETLNKAQYRKHYELISAFDLDVALVTRVIEIVPVNKNSSLVTLILEQSFSNQKWSFLDHKTMNVQTMLVVNDHGRAKILQVTSHGRDA